MSQRRRTTLTVLVVIVIIFVLFQIIPWGSVIPAFARTNPPVETQIQWDSPQTEQLVRATCYDCHSNETTWPWYAQIAPISWLVAKDTNEGREELNFSEQSADQINPERLVDEIEEGGMPPRSYTMLHPSASLSDAQKDELIAGLRASLHGQGGSEGSSESGGGDDDE